MEDRSPINPSAEPINKAFDGFLKNPNESFAFDQTPSPLISKPLDKSLFENPVESGLLKELSLIPGQTNDESLNGLFEEPGLNREADLGNEEENPEQVAGLGKSWKIYFR